MSRWKITDAPAFSTLINFIKQTKAASDANASDVASLQEDIQGLATQTTQMFAEVDTALSDMDNEKLDKTNEVAASIPANGWQSDTSVSDYPYYYDLAVTELTANDRASVIIAPTSVKTAVSCGICPTCESFAGKIRIRSVQVPSSTVAVCYRIEKGMV